MKLSRLITLLFLLVLMQPAPLTAVTGIGKPFYDRFSVRCITMREGLPHNFVEDIFRDSYGYLWVATSASLTRYDGYDFVNITTNTPGCSLKSTFVRKIAEDRFGRLWVASDGGVDVINLSDLSPVSPWTEDSRMGDLSILPTECVAVDTEGNVWLRNRHQVVGISLDDKGMVEDVHTVDHNTVSAFPTNMLKSVEQLGKGVLTGIGGVVSRLTLGKGGITSTGVCPPMFGGDVYISDFVFLNDDLWISTDIGLYRHNISSGAVMTYYNIPGNAGSLTQNFVTSLAVASDGSLIAGDRKSVV